MSVLTVILLVTDILCLVAAAFCLVTFLIIALIKKIKKEPAKKYVINAFLYCIYCLMACVVITWLMKMGMSIGARFRAI